MIEPIDWSRRRLLIGAALTPCVGVLTGCTTASPVYLPGPTESVPLPVARVGQRWRYQLINRYNGQSLGLRVATVSRVDGSQVLVSIADGDGVPLGEERYESPWRVVEDMGFDRPQVFAQPVPRLPSVLRTGLHERFSTTYHVTGNSSRLPWSQWLSAPGWERITVPAGTFECLRVERFIRFQHSDLFREQPERFETLWYAPAVERWVQREWTGTYYWPGTPPTRLNEDWVLTQLIDYSAAPTS